MYLCIHFRHDSNVFFEQVSLSFKLYFHFSRPRLPEYILDFSHVVLGTVRTHVVRATNTGWFPASFSVEKDHLHQSGFSVELDRVKNLPGAPDHETVDFVVSFDPRGANLSLGEIETVIPINVGSSISALHAHL